MTIITLIFEPFTLCFCSSFYPQLFSQKLKTGEWKKYRVRCTSCLFEMSTYRWKIFCCCCCRQNTVILYFFTIINVLKNTRWCRYIQKNTYYCIWGTVTVITFDWITSSLYSLHKSLFLNFSSKIVYLTQFWCKHFFLRFLANFWYGLNVDNDAWLLVDM